MENDVNDDDSYRHCRYYRTRWAWPWTIIVVVSMQLYWPERNPWIDTWPLGIARWPQLRRRTESILVVVMAVMVMVVETKQDE